MRTSRSSIPSVPQPFRVLVHLLEWTCDRLGDIVGGEAGKHRRALEVVAAVLLTLLVTAVGSLGLNPVLTVGAGLSAAVLFVIAHSCILANEQQVA